MSHLYGCLILARVLADLADNVGLVGGMVVAHGAGGEVKLVSAA